MEFCSIYLSFAYKCDTSLCRVYTLVTQNVANYVNNNVMNDFLDASKGIFLRRRFPRIMKCKLHLYTCASCPLKERPLIFKTKMKNECGEFCRENRVSIPKN